MFQVESGLIIEYMGYRSRNQLRKAELSHDEGETDEWMDLQKHPQQFVTQSWAQVYRLLK